ncbi:MAG: 6-bladed beta-propeller [Parabacteroides sp.]|nr:6-bladed beta-propeller [Parabacteroides sp.]
MKKYCLLLVFCSLFFSCEEHISIEDNSVITVDVTESYSKKELYLQDIFDIEYIPLETSDDFITSGQVQDVGDKFIVVKNQGRTDGNIFIFDRKGKGVRVINHRGNGVGEYLNILKVVLDENQEELLVNSHYSKKILVYDLCGNFKRFFNQREKYFYDDMNILNKDYLICHDGYVNFEGENVKRNLFLLISRQDGKEEDINIPYDNMKTNLIIENKNGKIRDWSIFNKQLLPYKDGFVLVELSSDTIYKCSSDKMLSPFIIREPSIQVMEPEVYLYPNVLTERYCFMQTVKKQFDFDVDKDLERKDLVYDRKEKRIFEVSLYNKDFVEKTPVNIMFDPFGLSFVKNENIAFVKKIDAAELVERYRDGGLQGELKEIASHLDEEDNPVVMIFKYKRYE